MSYYVEYYSDQIGAGVGREGIRRVFAGSSFHRGHGGISHFLSGLFRRVLPYLTSGAKPVGKEAIKAGMNVLDDVGNHGLSFKQAVNTRARESGRNLKYKAADKIPEIMNGSGYKRGGKKRKRQSRTSCITGCSSTSGSVKKDVSVRVKFEARKKENTAGHMETPPNTPVTDATANKENVYRQYFLINDQTVDLIGHLHCDVFNQNKFLLNVVELRFRLVRRASLIVRRESRDYVSTYANTLSKATSKYPINRVEVKAFTLHSGVHGDTLDNVILGQIPKRIIIGFVDNRVQKWLKTVMSREVVNVEEMYAPAFQELKKNYLDRFMCLNDSIQNTNNTRDCAVNQAYLLRKWLHSIAEDITQDSAQKFSDALYCKLHSRVRTATSIYSGPGSDVVHHN
ncbi:hypothetical protein TSAR_016913 [Trichomalopsis sarcophagae]|uniref:Uncharacterized protein n=1 Tax=Trichomalopsis sarcophagae TaxID=543379 RepID=A0A232F5J6_9HYME|nr:hypothetical protein TSAR_016913 [Trichomalopsis sarcophagae]